jgi:Na+/melibiose symporter-like transporter
MRLIWLALQRKEVYQIIIYILLDGLTSPSFGDFSYFFLMNVIGISKFMFAMITLIGSVCGVIGVLIYTAFLREVEVRTIIMWNYVIGVFGAILNYLFAKRYNKRWGIDDLTFIIFTTIVFGSLSTAF